MIVSHDAVDTVAGPGIVVVVTGGGIVVEVVVVAVVLVEEVAALDVGDDTAAESVDVDGVGAAVPSLSLSLVIMNTIATAAAAITTELSRTHSPVLDRAVGTT